MKFRKLLAAGLAACSLLTLAACKSSDGTTDWDQYKQEDNALNSVTAGSGTLYFESIDSDTVKITGYSGPEEPHALTIPATVQTSTDTSIAPKKVTAIAEKAFHSFSNLTEVILPEGLTEIGNYAFAECKQLTKVSLPKTLEKIGDAAFYACAKLTEVGALGETALTELPAMCFLECTALTTLTIPANIKTVGMSAFQGCTGLTEVTLAEGVETLGNQCFLNAANLANLTLPSTLKNTDPKADLTFYGTEKLTTVNVPTGAPESVKQFADDLLGNDEA